MTENAGYRTLTLTDLEQMVHVLSTAFEEDPLVSFILPKKETRVKTVAKFFRAMGRLNIQNKLAFGVSDPLEGVAVWNFPDKPNISATLKDLIAFLPLLFSSYPLGAQRARAIFRQLDTMHKKYASEPHFYLDNLGVLPSARGKGLSSQLIRPFLEMADSQKVVAYTDTVTPSNAPLYEHFGFQCVEETHIPSTGITVFALRRPIRA
ncbi:MAG TPA: GNAT family N-acetyltransferase [Anaerolineales bacterium]|nr:GNAT family N-acetyltransferase [Anaerolineales bacterium]